MNAVVERRADGTTYVRSPHALGPHAEKLTERLEHWAAHTPERTFLAQRDAAGAWRRLTYADALARTRRIAQALLARGLSAERPIAILSGNGIEHALLALAAMHAGVPYAPVAPEYSLLSRDHATLRYVLEQIRPALLLAAEGASYERALRNVLPGMLPHRVEVVAASTAPRWVESTPFAALEAGDATPAVDAAHAQVGPDTIAKVLFTAGSTGRPKGVITTQRMLCSNQQMLRAVLPFVADEPPVLCDWLPWNHVFGGSHNFGLVLHNGGTLYVDEGKPTPAGIETTVRNLADVATTAYFNVPRGFELLIPYLRDDEALRGRFFGRLRIMFYAAAGLAQRHWDELAALSVQACGARVPMLTGLGATESAPFALCTGRAPARAGMVGLPAPGVDVKLVPDGSTDGTRLELRLRGPNVTPGYWRQDALTRAAFDEEGYCRLGDAVRWVDPADPRRGLAFDGRLDDDFKLSTGTWVSVAALRARLLARLGALALDVVLAGRDRHAVAALIFPSVEACRKLCPPGAADLPTRALLARPEVRAAFREALGGEGGSSRRVARAVLLDEPPSVDAGELTSKRSVSQGAVLRHRAALVEELYAAPPSPRVIMIEDAFRESHEAPAGATT